MLGGLGLLLIFFGVASGRAQQPWPLWEAYTRRFVDDQGRVIDRSDHDRTTSEGQSYALFFALVDNDRPHFEKLLHWTEANLAGGDLTLRLPAWHWGQDSSGAWKTIDDNPASDADLWLAYTLIQAGRLWHQPRYDKLGRILAERIAREEVVAIPMVGTTLSPGIKGFHTDPNVYILNPSYLPLPIIVSLAQTLPQGPWGAVRASLPKLLNARIAHRFAMDWVSATASGVHPAAAPGGTASVAQSGAPPGAPPVGSYDAIRVYLWLGIAAPDTPGLRPLLAGVSGMAAYLRTAITPPLQVDSQGHIVRADAPVGFSAAVVPYLHAAGMATQQRMQEDRMIAARDPGNGLYGKAGEYYDENLALFSTGWSENRYAFDRLGKLHVKWK